MKTDWRSGNSLVHGSARGQDGYTTIVVVVSQSESVARLEPLMISVHIMNSPAFLVLAVCQVLEGRSDTHVTFDVQSEMEGERL